MSVLCPSNCFFLLFCLYCFDLVQHFSLLRFCAWCSFEFLFVYIHIAWWLFYYIAIKLFPTCTAFDDLFGVFNQMWRSTGKRHASKTPTPKFRYEHNWILTSTSWNMPFSHGSSQITKANYELQSIWRKNIFDEILEKV